MRQAIQCWQDDGCARNRVLACLALNWSHHAMDCSNVCLRVVHRAVTAILFLCLGLIASNAALAQIGAAGFTAGQHAVGKSGDASYSIPIVLPPGRGGMEPNLGFSYSSHAGNGLLGIGFNLQGFSQITRCAKTLAQDGTVSAPELNANDRFCLDGRRLVAAAGVYGQAASEYRTEGDITTRITYSGPAPTPATFILQTKDGKRIEYGGSVDSTLRNNTLDVSWSIKSVSDVYGNKYTFSYQNSGAELYPLQIDYTLNTASGSAAFNSARFTYENRPDTQVAYIAGFAIRTTVRLTAVQAFNGSSKIREYRVSYRNSAASGNSQISRIQECAFGTAAPTGSCLAPTSFVWTPDIAPGLQEPAVQSGSFPSTAERYHLGDFNGDGRTDIFAVRAFGGWELFQATGYGFSSVASGSWPSTGEKYFLGDFDGDGKTDVFVIPLNGGWKMYRSTGTGIQEVGSGGWPSNLENYVVGDFSGDGKADLLVLPDAGGWRLYTWAGNNLQELANGGWPGKGEKFYVGDFDGDGRSDLFVTPLSGGWKMMLWNGSSFVEKSGGAWPSSGENYFLGDFNGDGKTDLFVIPLSGGWKLYHSTGIGILQVASGAWPSSLEKFYPGDLNGDGKTDLLVISAQGGWKLYYSTGSNIALKSEGGWPSTSELYQVDDFGGIGKSEVFVNPMSGGYKYYRTGQNVDRPEAVQTIIKADYSGIGAVTNAVPTVQFAYRSLSDSSVYAKGSGANYPLVDIQPTIYVVSSTSVSDGLGFGGAQQHNYTYGGMRSASGSGRGVLGFAWMNVRDMSTGIDSYSEFRQDWPFIGSQSKTETRLNGFGNQGVLTRQSTSYASEGLSAALEFPANMRYFVYPALVTDERWDLDGSAFPKVTTTNEYEEPRLVAGAQQWGNLTKSSVTTNDGHSKVVVNNYRTANTNNWIIGRLSRSTVTATSPARSVVAAQPRLILTNCINVSSTTAPTAATMTCSVSNAGASPATSVAYTTAAGTAVSGPTGACLAGAVCGTVVVTSGSGAASYSGTLTATPTAGTAATQPIDLVVKTPANLVFSACTSTTPTMAPTAATVTCVLGNAGQTAAGSISYAYPAGTSAIGPTTTCLANSTCGTVTLNTGSAPATYSGNLMAIPNNGVSAKQSVTLVVTPPIALFSYVSRAATLSKAYATITYTFRNDNASTASITGVGVNYGAITSGGTCTSGNALAAGATCTVIVRANRICEESIEVIASLTNAAGKRYSTPYYLPMLVSKLGCY